MILRRIVYGPMSQEDADAATAGARALGHWVDYWPHPVEMRALLSDHLSRPPPGRREYRRLFLIREGAEELRYTHVFGSVIGIVRDALVAARASQSVIANVIFADSRPNAELAFSSTDVAWLLAFPDGVAVASAWRTNGGISPGLAYEGCRAGWFPPSVALAARAMFLKRRPRNLVDQQRLLFAAVRERLDSVFAPAAGPVPG